MSELRQRRPREHDETHLAFVRTLPCIVTKTTVGIQAAHISFADPRICKRQTGMAEKADDRYVLPLCAEQHDIQHNMRERTYWLQVGIDPIIYALAIALNTGDYPRAYEIVMAAPTRA